MQAMQAFRANGCGFAELATTVCPDVGPNIWLDVGGCFSCVCRDAGPDLWLDVRGCVSRMEPACVCTVRVQDFTNNRPTGQLEFRHGNYLCGTGLVRLHKRELPNRVHSLHSFAGHTLARTAVGSGRHTSLRAYPLCPCWPGPICERPAAHFQVCLHTVRCSKAT